jgi:hypothetical protein
MEQITLSLILDTRELFLNENINSPALVFKNIYRLKYDGNNPAHKKLYAKLLEFFKEKGCACSLDYLRDELHMDVRLMTSPYIRQLREEQENE